MSSKAALLCFISTGFVTAFKLLYKESIDTVNRPLIKHPITQSINWIDRCGIPATNPAYGSVLNSLFINIINNHSLEQLVCSPTRLNNILDLVFSTQPDLISEVETIPGISDHEAITFTIRNIVHIQKKQTHKVYLYHKCNLDAIKVDILKFQRSFMQSDPYTRTVDNIWTFFKSFILDLLYKYEPQKTCKSHKNLIKIYPGLILVLSVHEMRHRKHLYNRAKQSNLSTDWGV